MDQRAFILGMITAFSECVAGGCKRLALSPPLTPEIYAEVHQEAEEIIEKHGLLHYFEENKDLPEAEHFYWILIAAEQKTIEEYLQIRKEGYNPAQSLRPFYSVLSYNPATAIHTGYDAYRAYYPANQ